MDTILVQITNKKAYKLLQDLEDLNILRVLVKKQDQNENFGQKYYGKLSDAGATTLRQQISDDRQ